MAAIAVEISAPFGASHSWNCWFKIKCADAVWVELVMNVQMCVHSARVTPPPRPTWPRKNIGKANRTCTIHARHTAHYQASLAHNGKILPWSTNPLKKNAPKGAGSSVAIAAMFWWNSEIFFHTRSGNPGRECRKLRPVSALIKKIPWKRCAERHRELGGYSRQVSSRRKSEYLSMSVTTHLQYRKLIPFF